MTLRIIGGTRCGRWLTAVACGWMALPARADIYEWTTGLDGSIVQSSTVCPGGSGVNAVPSVNLGSLDLTQAYLGRSGSVILPTLI